MTAVLNELRALETARRRGDIDDTEFLRARTDLVEAIEDAEFAATEQRRDPSPVRAGDLVNLIVLTLGGFMLCTLIATWALGDLTLGLTISTTLLAAVMVRAFHKLDR